MTAQDPAPSKKRQRPWGRILLWTLAAGVGLGTVSLLFARSALLRRARNEGLDVQEISTTQLVARTASRPIPGGLGRLHAIGVRAQWSPAPVQVHVEHLEYQPPENRLNKPIPSRSGPGPASPVSRDPRPRTRSIPTWAREWIDAQDWDLHIEHGPSLEIEDNNRLALEKIHVQRKSGKLDFKANLNLANKKRATLHCKPQGPLSWSSAHLRCEAPEIFKDPIELDLERKERHVDIRLRQGDRSVQIVRDSKQNTWHLHTERFPALWWRAAASMFSLPTLALLKVQDQAQLSIRLDLSAPKAPDQTRKLTLHDLNVQGLVLDDRRISPQLVHLPPIQASGELKVALRKRHSTGGELAMTLGELKMDAKWELSDKRHRIELRAPSQPCMRWLDTLPRGMRPALEGMKLEGEGAVALTLDYDPQKRSKFQEDNEESKPGTVDLQFPLFESCKVLKDPTLLTKAPVASSSYEHTWPKVGTDRKPRRMGSSGKDFVSLHRMPWFSKAMTVTEDPNFWDHKGFDTHAIETALWYDLAKLRIARGASTISQQCARMLWLGTHRDLARKVQELILTWRLEATVSKRRILELYLNLIELGPGIHGGPDAARYYFGRSLTALNLKESLFLATLAPAPARKSQASAEGKISSDWNDNLLRQIERLRIRGWITSEQAQDAVIEPLGLKDRSGEDNKAAKRR